MASPRVVLLCCLLAITVAGALCEITVGTCQTGDRILLVHTVRKDSKFLQIQHELVKYKGGLISCIKMESLKVTNTGSAVVQKGGPGQKEVEVMVKSLRGHSVAWVITVLGKL